MAAASKLAPLLEHLEGLDGPAELETLRRLLALSGLTRRDLAPHVRFLDEHYARNIVSKSPHYEMVCVCWRPGQATPVHDHRGSSCAFLVVEGEAVEKVYGHAVDGALGPLEGEHVRPTGYICASSEADIHEVRNDGPDELITLHIYSPALTQLNIYDPVTGRAQGWAPHTVET